MDRVATLGAGCTALAVLGYVIGVRSAYPGRALTLAGVMVGLTLLAIGGVRT